MRESSVQSADSQILGGGGVYTDTSQIINRVRLYTHLIFIFQITVHAVEIVYRTASILYLFNVRWPLKKRGRIKVAPPPQAQFSLGFQAVRL